MPVRSSARMAGTLSDCCSASRTRIGPGPLGVAFLGTQPAPKGVVISSRTEAAVSRPVSMPLAYTIGFQEDPGWRLAMPQWSICGSSFGGP